MNTSGTGQKQLPIHMLDEVELDAVSGGFASLGLAGEVARYTVKMWLLDYQIQRYDSATEIGRQGL